VERDHQLELELLGQAGVHNNYRRQVLARLDQFEHDNGGNLEGWDQAVDQVLVEAQEEAADITGWSIGAALQVVPERRAAIVEAMRHAAEAHRILEDLRLDLVFAA
jgi:hypothetical protein